MIAAYTCQDIKTVLQSVDQPKQRTDLVVSLGVGMACADKQRAKRCN